MQTTSRFRPAPVLAGLGTFLLTIAAVSFVAARWDRFGPGGRCAALLAFSLLVLGAGMALRRAAPVTAGALDVLTAALVPVDVAALAIVGGASWPAVLLVAGPVAVISAELLRSRSPAARPVAEIGTVVGGVLAAAGVAAGYELAMAPLVAGIGLLGCTMHPWSRERAAGVLWSALAGLAPALWVLDDVAFTGDGTMRRFGLLEPTEWVPTLLAGSMAVVGLAIAAARRRSLIVGTTGTAAAVATAAALWAAHQPPRSLLIVAGTILVVLVEVALTDRRVAQLGVAPGIDRAVMIAAAGLSATVAAMALSVLLPESVEPGIEWAYGAAILGFGWALRDVRLARRRDVAWTSMAVDGGPSSVANWGMATAALAALVLARGPATAAVVSAVAAAAFLASRRPGRLAIAWACSGAAALLAVGANAWLVAGVAVVGVTVISVVAVLLTADDVVLGRQSLLGVAAPVAVAGLAIGEHSVIGGAVAAAVGLWLVALIVDVADPQAAFVARVIGAAVLVSSVPVDTELAAWSLLAMALALIAHLTATRQTSSAVMAAAAGGLALALAVSDRWTAPVVVAALVVGLVGVSLVAFGLDRLLLPDPAAGHAVAGAGAFIVWVASLLTLAAAEVASPEPYVYPVLAALGIAIHVGSAGAAEADRGSPGWAAICIPAVGAALVAFPARAVSDNAGHLLVFGSVALAACAVGAWLRHHPTLVVGAAATVAVGSYEALDNIVGIESWGWLVISGSIAMTIAALLEILEEDELDAGVSGPRQRASR